MAALQATLSLLLVLSAYFASEENTNVIFFSGTILNIKHSSDYGFKARNLRYDHFYHMTQNKSYQNSRDTYHRVCALSKFRVCNVD